MIGHVLLYHPAITKLKQMVDAGEVGNILYIYSNRLNLGKFRTEENILWSFAPHDISIILHLLNEIPESVSAHGSSYLSANIADVTVTNLSFSSRAKAHIFVSWLHPYKEQKLIIVGGRKMIMFDDVNPDEKLIVYDHKIDWVERTPVPRPETGKPINIAKEEPLRNECKHFIDCVESRKAPLTNGKEGLRVLKVLELCQESLEKAGQKVHLKSKEPESFFIHESSRVDEPTKIGKGTKIWHFSHVLKNCKIGENCVIGQNASIGPNVTIGNNVKIQNNVSVYEGVTLEDDVFCGPSMVFTNVLNPRSHWPRKDEFKKTLVKRGTSLGANSTILCGNTIGQYAFVGAGSFVNKDVPDYALVVGSPAQIKGWMCYCGEKLEMDSSATSKKKVACKKCSRHYIKNGIKVTEVSQ
jgi:UDP-2-acetamido-3-amino-2,3-dideoxy-glucuronate N-acetyltransferase